MADRSKERSCIGKERLGEKHARRAARTLAKRQLEPVQAYPCQWCGAWHVGHSGGHSPYREGARRRRFG